MISSPVSSPEAPAGGWKVARAIPVISHRARSSLHSSSSATWIVSSGWWGWSRWNPGRAATCSATFGLYLIEHDPSGYKPVDLLSSPPFGDRDQQSPIDHRSGQEPLVDQGSLNLIRRAVGLDGELLEEWGVRPHQRDAREVCQPFCGVARLGQALPAELP